MMQTSQIPCTPDDTSDTNKNRIIIPTPVGNLEISESPDKEYPGVIVMLLDKTTGKEISAHVTEYLPDDGRIVTRFYGYQNPEGDPSHLLPMSPPKRKD